MARIRAADDFQTIRARMEELRVEREGGGRYGNEGAICAAIALSRQWRSDNHFYWPAEQRR